MMNSEELARMIVNGYSTELKALMSLGVDWIRNEKGAIHLDVNKINIYSKDTKIIINDNNGIINVTKEDGSPANMIDTLIGLKLFAAMMTSIKLKGFRVSYRGCHGRAATITMPDDITETVNVVIDAMLKGMENEDEDGTK